MARRYYVEDRLSYQQDPEESLLYERHFSTFSRARVYAQQLPLGGWIDVKEGSERRQVCNISARKARKCRRRKKHKKQ